MKKIAIALCALTLLTMGREVQAQAPNQYLDAGGAFDSVVKVLPDVNRELSEPPALDVQLMVWAPTALGSAPFLRLTRSRSGDIRSTVLLWWLLPPNIPTSRLPSTPRCVTSGAAPLCVEDVRVVGNPDWEALLSDIFAARECDFSHVSGSVAVGVDAGDIFVRIQRQDEPGYEAFSCNAPRGQSRPGTQAASRVMDELDAITSDARRPR
jgi:hypothetical protein